MLPTALALLTTTVMVGVSAVFLWTLIDLRRANRNFHKATRDVLDNLIVRVCELERITEHVTKNSDARRSDG